LEAFRQEAIVVEEHSTINKEESLRIMTIMRDSFVHLLKLIKSHDNHCGFCSCEE